MMSIGDGSEEVRAYRVEGRVQGVGFRWWTRRVARALDVRGSVRNVADGSVHVVAVGTVVRLEELEAALREGPPAGRVTSLRREEPPGSIDCASFDIVL
jgi:acylphosphatase